MPSRVDPARLTPTHIQCGRCHQWKLRREYQPGRYTCRECRKEQHRELYRSYSPEKLDAVLSRHLVTQRARRQKETNRRADEARMAVRALRAKGMSYWKIGQLCGVCNKTIKKIDEGERAWHRKETVDKVYDGLLVAIKTGGK